MIPPFLLSDRAGDVLVADAVVDPVDRIVLVAALAIRDAVSGNSAVVALTRRDAAGLHGWLGEVLGLDA